MVSGRTGADWMLMANMWAAMYFECAIPHNGAVDKYAPDENQGD